MGSEERPELYTKQQRAFCRLSRHHTSPDEDLERRGWGGARVGLGELGPLAQQVGHQLLSKGGVGGLGEEGLLLKDGKEGHGLLKHVNALLQIHAEVNVGPVQALPDIHLLLKGEHVLVEELLQLLIDVVDADLLEAVVVEDLKASDIQDSDVVNFLHRGINQCFIAFVHL